MIPRKKTKPNNENDQKAALGVMLEFSYSWTSIKRRLSGYPLVAV